MSQIDNPLINCLPVVLVLVIYYLLIVLSCFLIVLVLISNCLLIVLVIDRLLLSLSSSSIVFILSSSFSNSPLPTPQVFILRMFMCLVVGIISGAWVWSGKSLHSWRHLATRYLYSSVQYMYSECIVQ